MHYYLVEYHPYTRCFSFILKYSNKQEASLGEVFIADTNRQKIENSWVEVKLERNELIFAGSCILEPNRSYKSLLLIVVDNEGLEKRYSFPAPSFIDASIVGIEKHDSSFSVLHWAKDRISESVVNGAFSNHSVDSIKLQNSHFFKSKFSFDNGCGVQVHTCPPQSLRVEIPNLFELLDDSQDISKDILKYKNIHIGKDAWLIGNGPSVRYAELESLQNEITFGFNRLYLSYEKTCFRPSYVVSGDSQMISDFGEEIVNKSDCDTFLASSNPLSLDNEFVWLRQINMFPSLFSLNPQNFVTPGGASPYVAMQIAAFMGIKRIFLYGFDFDYKMKVSNDRAAGIKVTGDNNHFIDNYRSGKEWFPPSFRNIAHSFWNAKTYFESIGGEIINCTTNTKLNIFRKDAFESIKKNL